MAVAAAVGPAAAARASPPAAIYFVDFRADLVSITGHTFVVFGRVGANQQPISIQHADIFPEDKDVGLLFGLFLPVRANIHVINGDSRRAAVISYRRYLTAVEFARMLAAIRSERLIKRRWNAFWFNCNDFANAVAGAIRLRRPSTLLAPHAYVAALRLLNGWTD